MREINVIGRIILSDEFSIHRVDLPNNRTDDIGDLRDMGVSQSTIESLNFNRGTEDIVGQFKGEKIAIEAKGVTGEYASNFTYWGKGMINQMVQLDDKTEANSVGIAVPEEVSETLRGIFSSYHSSVSEEKAQNMSPQEVYGERQSSILRQYADNDYVILAGSEGIDVQKLCEFFGISRSTSNSMARVTFGLVDEIEPPETSNEEWCIRSYYDDTEQMGLVTHSDAPPKLYKNTKQKHMRKLMYKIKQSINEDS